MERRSGCTCRPHSGAVLKGNRSQSGFKPEVWAEITAKFNAKRAAAMSTNQLKTRDQHFRSVHLPEGEGYLWFRLGRRTPGSDSRGRHLGCFFTEISLGEAISGAGLAPLQHAPRGVRTPTGSHVLWRPQKESGSGSTPQAAAKQLSPQGLEEQDSGPHTPESESTASAGAGRGILPSPSSQRGSGVR